MKKFLDVNLQRKIKKKKIIKKYIKVFFLFLSFFVIMFVVWKISFKNMFFSRTNSNFPILYSGDAVLELEKFSGGFSVLTNNKLNFYNKNGKLLSNFKNSNPKMQIRSCQGNILCYEQDAKKFSIHNDKKILFTDKLENNICFGKIFKNNNFGFVTKGENYLSELVVYNKKNEQIFRWVCAEGLIVDFDLFDDLSGCVLTAIRSNDGFLKTLVYEIQFSNIEKSEKMKKDFKNYCPLAVFKFGSVIILVCDTKIFFMDSKGKIFNSVAYSTDLESFCVTDDGHFVGCFSSPGNSNFRNILISYDRFANFVAKLEVEDEVKKIQTKRNDILILTQNSIIKTKVNFKKIKKTNHDKNIEQFIYDDPYIYFVSMNKVGRFILE